MFSLGHLFQPAQSNSRKTTTSFDPDRYSKESVISEVIQQGKIWRIHYQGSYWDARCEQPVILNPGDTVYVLRRYNTLQLIKPCVSHIPVLR
jgi:membrane protein implicated in regulation of membrane protease activity